MSRKPLEYQIHISQIAGIILAILTSFAISLYYNLTNKQAFLDQNISNVGLLLSESAEVQQLLSSRTPSDSFNKKLDSLIQDMDYIDVITICDTSSIRYYHNDKHKIGGTFVGNDESLILEGNSPYITQAEGTLGMQRRAFYPVKNENQEIIGFVMAGILTASISQLTKDILKSFLLAAVVLSCIGIFLSHLVYLRLKNLLFGYRPEDFRKIHIEEKEVIDALEEGIVAINTEGELILFNESARSIFGFDTLPSPTTRLTELYPETRLPDILKTAVPVYNENLLIHGNHILANHIPIIKQGLAIGAISILRDKTEVTRLAETLTGTRCMVDTLRVFNHEFKNKLHVILGYIEIGETEKVRDLILHNSLVSSDAVSEVTSKIMVPGIAALLIGKLIRASELGIHLLLKPDCNCKEEPMNLPMEAYITILGNLIENAIEELNHQELPVKEIEVGIYIWDTGSILSVDDTGRGIPGDILDRIFQCGFSTKGENRGSGMYLIKEIVDRYHGEIEIDTEDQVGTSFTVTFS
ncbi:MAG: sensor histidine kinase [Lachnospiraceae bacterium]|nr:sensor histidine kinase [Lachnospiraceae bacterium]